MPTDLPDTDELAGYEEVRQVAQAWRSGEIATREEAITRAVEVFIEAKLTLVPRVALTRTKAEVAQIAREDPGLREQIERLLDRLAGDLNPVDK